MKKVLKKITCFMLIMCVITATLASAHVEAQAATSSKPTYYFTHLNKQKGGKVTSPWVASYYNTGVTKVIVKGNKLILYASFLKSGSKNMTATKKNFSPYKKYTFTLTSKTKYYYSEFDIKTDKMISIPTRKTNAIRTMKRLNGLGMTIKVQNGKVVYIRFSS